MPPVDRAALTATGDSVVVELDRVDRRRGGAEGSLGAAQLNAMARLRPWLPSALGKRWAQPVPLRLRKKQQLSVVLNALRKPKEGVGGLAALKCRVGAEMFHDRFIITRGRCWQLGCSFNQIGEVMSTIVEFPYPALIEKEFDRAWDKTKEEL